MAALQRLPSLLTTMHGTAKNQIPFTVTAMKRILLLTFLSACISFAADVTGKWAMSVQLDAGTGEPKIELKQTGEKVTGTYNGLLGSSPLAGTVKGNKIEFTFKAEYGGEKFDVTYSGTVEGDKSMKGTVKMGDLGSGTFAGTKE